MQELKRKSPVETAHQFIHTHFPDCQGAILAGSVVRGQETETSDLDIVIFDKKIAHSYRESLRIFGWPIEVFVHNLASYKEFFINDCKRARPSLPRMVSDGMIIKDEGIIETIKMEAQELMDNGPDEWSVDTINTKRYFLTDALDDFVGCSLRAEEIFIANTLAELTCEFILRTNFQWIGSSKWIVRSLRIYDGELTDSFVQAFDHFYRTGEKHKVVDFVQAVLKPYGGPLFDGFSIGKDD